MKIYILSFSPPLQTSSLGWEVQSWLGSDLLHLLFHWFLTGTLYYGYLEQEMASPLFHLILEALLTVGHSS